MGLRGTIMRAAQTAVKATGDIPFLVYVQRVASKDYDPVAGVPGGTVTTYAIPRAVVSAFDQRELTDEILATDRRMLLARLDLGSNVLNVGDTVYVGRVGTMTAQTDCGGNTTVDGGEKYVVKAELEGDAAQATAVYQLRP